MGQTRLNGELLHHFFEHLGIEVPDEDDMYKALEKVNKDMTKKGILKKDETILFSIANNKDINEANQELEKRTIGKKKKKS